VDRQYKYVFVGDSNYYGLLSYYPGECIDQVAEKGNAVEPRCGPPTHFTIIMNWGDNAALIL